MKRVRTKRCKKKNKKKQEDQKITDGEADTLMFFPLRSVVVKEAQVHMQEQIPIPIQLK